jgi:cytidine deaminase
MPKKIIDMEGSIMVNEKKLFNLARRVIENSYAPYSNFRVAAIVETRNGELYYGVNVENSSYGLSICAERVAVFNAVTHGHKDIEKVYIFAESDQPVSPCGACRQVISEFNPNATIISFSLKTGEKRIWNLEDLLPQQFRLKDNVE